jgi:hypothetical protein
MPLGSGVRPGGLLDERLVGGPEHPAIWRCGWFHPCRGPADYVIAGAGAALSSTQRDMIIAYKLGATGKLPDTVGA